jgi:precorrin-6A/cobalt-precorrin-6A reductase
MIGIIVGTSEGRELLKGLNEFTEDIFVSTATSYGGDLLKEYKYEILNTKPLNKEELEEKFKELDINLLIDASHPYAVEVSKNVIAVCNKLNIAYLRYERKGILEEFKEHPQVNIVSNFEDLEKRLRTFEGTILNTTGSKSVEKILKMNLKNRFMHRVLPSVEVMKKMIELGVSPDDIIALKGSHSEEFNRVCLREFNCKGILMKDSGKEGGTREKITAALKEGVEIFVIDKERIKYPKAFYNISELVSFVRSYINT